MRSHTRALNCARARHRNGISVSAPSARRASTSGTGPKSAAATRMNRNEPPQIAPSSVSSNSVRPRAGAAGAAAVSAGVASAELHSDAGMGH